LCCSLRFAPGHESGATVSRALVTTPSTSAAGVLPGSLAASLAPRIDTDFAFSQTALG
jgi:hypothetical protein